MQHTGTHLLAYLLVCAACGTNHNPEPETPAAPESTAPAIATPPSSEPQENGQDNSAPQQEAPADTANCLSTLLGDLPAYPTGVISVTDDEGNPGVRIRNTSDQTIQISSWLRVDQASDGATIPWVATDMHLSMATGLGFGMPARSGTQPECLNIAPGAELLMPGWDRVRARPRCPGCAPFYLQSGRYRYAALRCDQTPAWLCHAWSWSAPN